MQQTTVYQTVSAKTKPEKDGRYFCIHFYEGFPDILEGETILDFHDGGFWSEDEIHNLKWLKPTTGYFFTPEEFEKAKGVLYGLIHEEIMKARIKIWKMKDDANVSVAAIDDIISDLSTSAPECVINFYNQLTESK